LEELMRIPKRRSSQSPASDCDGRERGDAADFRCRDAVMPGRVTGFCSGTNWVAQRSCRLSLLLLCALVASFGAQGQVPTRCVPAVMSLAGEGDRDVAVLDMRGQWHVLSWAGVTWIALHAPEEKARCLARQLLLGASKVRSSSADTRCTGEWGTVMRIVSADPLIRACGAVPSCSVGDTCS
jgi:hypothetical protein